MANDYTPELVETRRALLDALDALPGQRDALVVIGAQAVFVHAGSVDTAIAVTTKDSDLAVDPEELEDDPLLEDALTEAGFHRDLARPQPGIWFTADGIEVDFLVPSSMALGDRGARIPPHHKHVARKAKGLEASLVDNQVLPIRSFDPLDERVHNVKIAGPAALVISKTHKLNDRLEAGERIQNKDAHDVYRVLASTNEVQLAATLIQLAANELAGDTTREALRHFERIFGNGPSSVGCELAGATEAEVGDPAQVSLATSVLASALLKEIAAIERGQLS